MTVMLALFLSCKLPGGNRAYRSDRLERMASALDGATSWNGFPLRIEEKDGTVEHIGYRFFSSEETLALGRDVSRFLERYALEADLPLEKEKSLETQLLEDGILFRSGSLSSLKSLCKEEHGDITLQSVTERRHLFSWSAGEMVFPADVELILGRSQTENDRRLPSEIASSAFEDQAPVPAMEDLTPREDGLLVLPGDFYYLESLSSDTYYDGSGIPVNSLLYESETLSNLFAGLIRDSAIELEIRMRVYGLKTQTLRVPLTSMAAYALENDCRSYVGIIARNKEEVELLVVYRNVSASYNHILRVQLSHECVGEGKGKASVRLTPFVPTHSVQYLFEELKK